MARLIINEDDGVEDAVSNITTHTKLPSSEARKLVRQARLRAAKEYKLPTNVADLDQDPPNAPPGFGAAWRQRASRAAMGDRTALFASDDNMPEDPKAKIEIMIQQVEDTLDSLKKEFNDLLTSDDTVNEAVKGWKHAGRDLQKSRSEASKSIKLVQLRKDGNESGLSDATKLFSSMDEANRQLTRVAELNPGKLFKYNVYDDNKLVGKIVNGEMVSETIKKTDKGYKLVSKSGKNLGEYPTKAGAEKRERQVNYFKHQNESKATKVDQLVSEMLHYARTNKQRLFKESVIQLQRYVRNDYPRVAKYIIENVSLGIKEAKRSKYGLPPISEDASSGASCSSSIALCSSNLLAAPQKTVVKRKQPAKTPLVDKLDGPEKTPIKNTPGLPDGVGTGVYEAKDPVAAIQKKIESLEKKYETIKGQLGMAREKRRMKGERLLSTREQTLQTKMSEVYAQILEIKQEKKELSKTKVSEGRFVKGPGGVPCDKYGNPLPAQTSKPKADKFGLTKSDYNQIWSEVETLVGNIFPDGDPNDYLPRILRKYMIADYDVGDVLEKAARLNGFRDVYDYWDKLKQEHGDTFESYDHDMSEESKKPKGVTSMRDGVPYTEYPYIEPKTKPGTAFSSKHLGNGKGSKGSQMGLGANSYQNSSPVIGQGSKHKVTEELDDSSRETYDDFIEWRSTAKQCNCVTKRMADGYYSAFDQDNTLVGEWDESQSEGWLDCGTCDLDEELVNELSPAAHQRYITAANKSRSEMTNKMRDQGVFDPEIERKMGDRAERTMKSINKLHSSNTGISR